MAQEEIKIKIDAAVESAGAAQTLGELKDSLKQAEEGSKSLRKQLREITEELQRTEVGSDRFTELTLKAGELKDQISDTQAAIQATAGSPVENLGKGLGTAVKIGLNGFQAVQGAMNAFGSDSKALQEGMAKLQGVMAMTQAISAFGQLGDDITNLKASFGSFTKSAIGGLQGVKGAVAATGIGLLVIAVGLLVSYWDDIKATMTGVSAEQEKLNKMAEAEVKLQQSKLDDLNAQDNILRLQGLSEKEILQLKIKQTDEVIAATEASIKNNEITFKAQYEAEKRNREILAGMLKFLQAPLYALLTAIDEIANLIPGVESNLAEGLIDFESRLLFDEDEVKENYDKQRKEQEKLLLDLRNSRAGMELEIQKIEKQAADERKRVANETLANAKASDADRLQAKRDIQDAELSLMEDGLEKELLANKYKYERLIEDTKLDEKLKNSEKKKLTDAYNAELKQSEEKIRQDYLEKSIEIENQRQIAIAEKRVAEATDRKSLYDAEIALLDTQYKIDISNTKITAEEKLKIDAEYNQKKKTLTADYQLFLAEQTQIEKATLLSATQYDLQNIEMTNEQKVESINKIRDLQIESLEASKVAELANTELTEAEKKAIEENYRQQRLDAEKNATDQIKALKKEELNATVETAEKGFAAGQALSDAVFAIKKRGLEKGSEEELKVAKKQFAVNKALQLGLAVIDGFKAVTNSLAQSPIAIGPVPNPAGIASLAFAIATSGANILKIAASQFEGGGATTPSASPPSVGGGGGGEGATTPQFTPSQFFGLGQTTPQSAGSGGNLQKVYVTETDITSTQNKVSVIENRAKIN